MSWSVSEAKAKLSELLSRARRSPQVIAARGEDVAVVLSVDEYARLREAASIAKPSPLSGWLDLTEPDRPAPFDAD